MLMINFANLLCKVYIACARVTASMSLSFKLSPTCLTLTLQTKNNHEHLECVVTPTIVVAHGWAGLDYV